MLNLSWPKLIRRRRSENVNTKEKYKKIDCQESQASLLSRLFFGWMTPMLVAGFKLPLHAESLPEIGIRDEFEPASIQRKFDLEWKRELERAASNSKAHGYYLFWMLEILGKARYWFLITKSKIFKMDSSALSESYLLEQKQPRLIHALYPLVSGYLVRAFIARLVTELIPIAVPVLLNFSAIYAQEKKYKGDKLHELPASKGYGLVFGIVVLLITYTLSAQWYFFEAGKTVIIVKTALASAIYRKALVLSAQARSQQTLGKLTNLISSDLGQIERGITTIVLCVTIPIQAIASIGVLVYMTGPSSISGWALLVGFVFFQMYVSKYLVRCRKMAVSLTDKRIRITREAFNGIKVVKCFAWEDSITDRLQRIRSEEIRWVAYMNMIKYALVSSAINVPIFSSIITFSIYVLTGGKLMAGQAFAVIAIFSSMCVPLSWLPASIADARNSTVNLKRISEMLLEKELAPFSPINRSLDVAIRIEHGQFFWGHDGSDYTEEHVNDNDENEKSDNNNNIISISRDLENGRDEPGPRISSKRHGHSKRRKAIGRAQENDTFYKYRFPQRSENGIPDPFRLTSINTEIMHGSLVAVIGPVGSGKTSLISALIGEMERSSGTISFGGTISYAPQTPWISSGTIRDNIIFGLPFDSERYADVIESCCLDLDISEIPGGDSSELGDRGVTLSGGQKQRIGIARAAYSHSDIVILDDSLSSVDVKVSQLIFRHCVKGILSGRTRILVTHNLDLLPFVDYIITMNQGRIVEQGPASALLNLGGTTTIMYRSFFSTNEFETPPYFSDGSLETASMIKNAENISDKENEERISDGVSIRDMQIITDFLIGDTAVNTFDSDSQERNISSDNSNSSSNFRIYSRNIGNRDGVYGSGNTCGDIVVTKRLESGKRRLNADKAIVPEERTTGQVSLSTYISYILSGGGWVLFAGIIACLSVTQGCKVGSDFWMRIWVRHRDIERTTGLYIGVYVVLGLLQFVWFFFFAGLLTLSTYKASLAMHKAALARVFASPMSFFETTPLGRILNRFTRDIDTLDLSLCDSFRQFYQNTSRAIGTFISIAILIPVFLIPLFPLTFVCCFLILVYLRTSVELQRVAAISRSPMYSHYAETLHGLSVIRAFRSQERFVIRYNRTIDQSNRPQWYSLVAQNWIWIRTDFVSHLLTLIVCIIIVAQPERWDGATVGLLLAHATQMGSHVSYSGRGWTELQNNMNSAERIYHYSKKLELENDKNNRDSRIKDRDTIPGTPVLNSIVPDLGIAVPKSWPKNGTIIIKSLSMRYRPGLPLSLKAVSLEIQDGEHIAIVGRSGAGKSSIVSALFRLVTPECGKIYIDGIDIQTLPLKVLRKRMAILPQDPVLFEGTLRSNLDPMDEYTDSDIWRILELSFLKNVASLSPQKLDTPINENGENLSLGQKQLICLARALLRNPKILILDEATANIDHDTDSAIQGIIQNMLKNTTVINIAHRLQTIIDYDKVAVMDDGHIVEFGTPLSLLQQESHGVHSGYKHEPSLFHKMIHEMGEDVAHSLYQKAKNAGGSQFTKTEYR